MTVTVKCKFFFAVKLSKLCGVFYDSCLSNLEANISLPIVFKTRTDCFELSAVQRGT